MSATIEANLSNAGAIVTGDPGSENSVPYIARTYTHPALAERKIVRLLPDALQEAEDLAVSTFGLNGESKVDVGYGIRMALGFPAWPLIHDPANAQHALALVKDLERVGRKAKTKPGQAKGDVDVLAERLGASAPHFLPTFLEEVGRIFLRLDNKAYAAQFFGKARTAERVHNLSIDETRHREVLLEFAFAGAISAKALGEEARDLPTRVSPAEAYALFRNLCVQRTLGGLPPFATMGKDLRSMAKAAGLDAALEDQSVITELLEAPSLHSASVAFWTSYAKAISAAAKQNPRVKALLLGVFPSAVASTTWVNLLNASAAVDLLKSGDVEPRKWLGQMLDHHHGYRGYGYVAANPELESLIAELAPALQSSSGELAVAAKIVVSSLRGFDLSILDVLLEHGLELSCVDNYQHRLEVEKYLGRANNSRSLEHLASSTTWQQLLRRGIRDALFDSAAVHPELNVRVTANYRLAQVAQCPGVLATVRAMVGESVALANDSLHHLGLALSLAECFAAEAGQAMVGDLITGLPEPSTEKLLSEVLNAGILDELGWESFESVMSEHSGRKRNNRPGINSAWPAAVITVEDRATVIGRDGIVLDHLAHRFSNYPLNHPGGTGYIFTGTELLVHWPSDAINGLAAYWASNPQQVFELDASYLHGFSESLPVGKHGRTFGHREFRDLERSVPVSRYCSVQGDGDHFWLETTSFQQSKQSGFKWQELDVSTGALGRSSLPSFLSEIASRPGHTLDPARCSVRPASPDFKDSPLGWNAGVIGHALYTDAAGVLWLERTDGVKCAQIPGDGPVSRSSNRAQLLSLPGGAIINVSENYIVNAHTGVITGTLDSGSRFSFNAGSRTPVPAKLRHNMLPRDRANSARLRTVRATELHDIVAVASTDPQQSITLAESRALEKAFPLVQANLAAGIIGIVRGAKRDTQTAHQLRDLAVRALANVASSANPPTSAPAGSEALEVGGPAPSAGTATEGKPDNPAAHPALLGQLPRALSQLTYNHRGFNSGNESVASLLANVRVVGEIFSKETPPPLAETKSVDGLLQRFKRMFAPVAATEAPKPPATAPEMSITWAPDTGVWTQFFHSPAALIAIAMAPQTDSLDRERLAMMLEAFADAGLAQRQGELGSVRLLAKKNRNLAPGQMLTTDRGRILLISVAELHASNDGVHLTAITQGSPSFAELGLDVLWTSEPSGHPYSAAELKTAATLIRTAQVPLRAHQAAELAQETGMLEEEALYLFAALPKPDYHSGHLSPAVVKAIGLTATSSRLAMETFGHIDTARIQQLLSSLVPVTVDRFFTDGPDVHAAATAWITLLGPKATVESELVRAAFADLKEVKDRTHLLRWALTPASGPIAWSNALPDEYLEVCLWLAYNLKANHPGRNHLAAKITEARALRTENLSSLYLSSSETNDFRAIHGLPPKPRGKAALPNAQPPLGKESLGVYTVDYNFHDFYTAVAYDKIYADLGKFSAHDLPVLDTLSHTGLYARNVRLLRALFDPKLDPFINSLEEEQPAEGYFQDPSLSAPETVSAVRSALNLSQDQSVLFLQLLALPDPTNAKVQNWNGWTSTKRAQVGGELEAATLVGSGKRARAGRDLFLPGGWVTLPGTSLPIESWKSELYGLPAGDKPPLRHETLLITESVQQLFERAWLRYQSGDKPHYDELRTGRS